MQEKTENANSQIVRSTEDEETKQWLEMRN